MENVFFNVVSDVHICGACNSQFSLVESFVAHIRCCSKRVVTTSKDLARCTESPHLLPTVALHISDENLFSTNDELVTVTNAADITPPVQPPCTITTAITTAAAIAPSLSTSVFSMSSVTVPVTTQGTVPDEIVSLPSENPSPPVSNNTSASSTQEVAKFKKVSVLGEQKFGCTFKMCPFTSLYMKDMERHYRTHTGEKPYSCWQCNKRFSRKDKLKVHEMAHNGEKPFKCLECNYATNDNSSLVKHKRVHTGERPYKCQICPYASRNASQLVVHLRTHTGDTPFHCRLCNMKFKINSDLKRHSRLHTGEKPYVCSFCGYRCSIKGNLNIHMKSHNSEMQQQCGLCDFETSSRKDLHAHERLHQARAYQCHLCSYTARNQSALNVHIRIHSHEKPFKCQFCNFTSRQACNVRTHIKKKHSEKLPGSSKSRKKGAGKNKTQTNHLKTSKPVCKKTFKCKVCKSGFVRLDSLRCHLRQHEAEQLLAQAESEARTNAESLQAPCCTNLQENILNLEPSVLENKLFDTESLINSDVVVEASISTPQTVNTMITTCSTPSTPTSELGVYQVYQMAGNLGFVTLPVVSSASTQNTFSTNVLSGFSDLDATSLVNSSTSTLLQISGLGPNVQYVITPAKLDSNTCS